jgi:hypothetical protein
MFAGFLSDDRRDNRLRRPFRCGRHAVLTSAFSPYLATRTTGYE